MKKILALLLALVMVFSLVACASKTETPATETKTEETATETTTEEKTEEPAAEDEKTEEPAAEEGKHALIVELDEVAFAQAHVALDTFAVDLDALEADIFLQQ